MSIFKKIFPYFAPYRRQLFWGLIFVLLANGFKVAGPWVLRYAVNGLETEISYTALWISAGMILGVAILSGIFRFLMRKYVISLSRYIEYDLRQDLFKHLLNLEPAFYDRSRVGDLMARLTSDVERVRMVIGPALMYSVNTLFGLVFGLTLMMIISPLLTVFVAVIVPLVATIVFYLGRKIHRASTLSQEALSDISATVQENLAGIRVVKSFSQEENQKSLFNKKNKVYFERSYRVGLLQGIFFPTVMLIFGAAIAGILLIGGYFIIIGKMLVGDFLAFTSYLMILSWPMISIGWVVGLVQRGSASLTRLMDLLDTPPQQEEMQATGLVKSIRGDILMEDVTLKYPGMDYTALKNINFSLKAGNSQGIVGRVGCGKSSIISLLARLYDPSEGKILIDEFPVKDLSLHELRECFGVVPQDPLLFSTTIRENITLGHSDYTDGDLNDALEISRLVQDLDDFPNKLETEVGERGITLSGGQKQRVAIARAVIRKPKILILDDALSAVDSDTEEKIVENLNHYLVNRSAIIVSHRVSSVRNTDEILVLDEGEIVERGTHEDLLSIHGLYYDLFKRQEMAKELEVV